MKTKLLLILFLMSIIALMLNSCSKDDNSDSATPTTNPPMSARDSALQDYNTNYLGSAVTNPDWTGSTATCTAGTVSASASAAVIKRINYFRRLVGLNDDCTLDTSYNVQEQEAALMMSANNSLNHNPPTTWLCYTTAGHDGAASSNLASGTNTSGSITAFINDGGTGNYFVGHRRWILQGSKQKFSFGSTSNAMALYVFANGSNTHIPAFIAYPPKGYIPQTLINQTSRWSFSIPSAIFSGATVTMTGPSGNVPLTVVSTSNNGYGDNTIVWEPTIASADLTSTSDVNFTITVSGVAGAAQTTYTYTTTIFKP
jgi:hypothetical protein